MQNVLGLGFSIITIAACIYVIFAVKNNWVRAAAGGMLMLAMGYMVTKVSYMTLMTYGMGWEFVGHTLFGIVSMVGAILFLLLTSDLV